MSKGIPIHKKVFALPYYQYWYQCSLPPTVPR
jgi:hypothetical protein